MFEEAWRLPPRLLAIAEASGDILMLHHAWLTASIQVSQIGDNVKALYWCDRIIASDREQQAINPVPYTVNPFAPMDPVVWALGHTCNIASMQGDFRLLSHTLLEIFPLVERNAEPVAYQQSIFHHSWCSWTAELQQNEIDRFWAHVKSSNFQMVSLLLEVLFALLQRDSSTDADTFNANAERIWAKFCAGASFNMVLGTPMCQLLLSAGLWRQGLTLVDRWKAMSDDEVNLQFNSSDFLRFRALFLLQKAHHDSSASRDDEALHGGVDKAAGVDSPTSLVLESLAVLRRSALKARDLGVAALELKTLLSSIYVRSALLHVPFVPSSEFPPSCLLCPPNIGLDTFLSHLDVGQSPLISQRLLAEEKERVMEVVTAIEAASTGCDLLELSTLIPRAKRAAGL